MNLSYFSYNFLIKKKEKLQTIYDFLLFIPLLKLLLHRRAYRSGNVKTNPVYQLNHDQILHSVRTVRAGSIIRVTLFCGSPRLYVSVYSVS